MTDTTKAFNAAKAIEAMREALGVYGDMCLGIPGQVLTSAEQADFETYRRSVAFPPPTDMTLRLRITRRSNVVVEVGGHVVAAAFTTHHISGRKAKREAAERWMDDYEARQSQTVEDLLGVPRAPKIGSMQD